jgi:hypothetical protein
MSYLIALVEYDESKDLPLKFLDVPGTRVPNVLRTLLLLEIGDHLRDVEIYLDEYSIHFATGRVLPFLRWAFGVFRSRVQKMAETIEVLVETEYHTGDGGWSVVPSVNVAKINFKAENYPSKKIYRRIERCECLEFLLEIDRILSLAIEKRCEVVFIGPDFNPLDLPGRAHDVREGK